MSPLVIEESDDSFVKIICEGDLQPQDAERLFACSHKLESRGFREILLMVDVSQIGTMRAATRKAWREEFVNAGINTKHRIAFLGASTTMKITLPAIMHMHSSMRAMEIRFFDNDDDAVSWLKKTPGG